MFDIFYTGSPSILTPTLFFNADGSILRLPSIRRVIDLGQAREQSRTKFFWLLDARYDYSEFGAELLTWLPPFWEQHQIHMHEFISQFGERFHAIFACKESVKIIEHWYEPKPLMRRADPALFEILKPGIDWVIDSDWCPDPRDDKPYIHVFGNPWYSASEMPTVQYNMLGAIDYKYCNDVSLVTLLADPSKFEILKPGIDWKIDYNAWTPNPFDDQEYDYVFGNPWYSAEEMPTVRYRVNPQHFVAEKYISSDVKVVSFKADPSKFEILKPGFEIDYDNLSWAPNPFDPEPYIYIFGNKWYSAEEMPTARYVSESADGGPEKYVDSSVQIFKRGTVDPSLFVALIPGIDASNIIDNWEPNPFADKPYIYVFGNQWYSAEEMPTLEYRMAGATERSYVPCQPWQTALAANKAYWGEIPPELDQGKLDFSWVPPLIEDQAYIYHFGPSLEEACGLTYTVPGATSVKYGGPVPLLDKSKLVSSNLVDIFFIDMSNKSSAARYEALKIRYPGIIKMRFINGWIETIKRCCAKASTSRFWVISSENIYTSFNFAWAPTVWQTSMTHVFGSQWQKWSDTFIISKAEFMRHMSWAKNMSDLPNLNFVKDQLVSRPDDLYDIYFIDHGNMGGAGSLVKIQSRYPDVKQARYVDNYLDTFRRIVSSAETEYIWITNSICDYSKFDFTWQPEPWQAKMLHVFPSMDQKFGDTFYMHVPTFKEQMDKLELLDWFDTVNYCNDQVVPRMPMDIIEYQTDSVVSKLSEYTFTGPYAVFHNKSIKKEQIPAFSPSIWRKKDRVVHVLSKSGSVILVPREAKEAIKEQVYDFPYILPHSELFAKDQNLDIVYISNGEEDAEHLYQHLISMNNSNNKIHWVKDVEGRDKALKQAAFISGTPWFFGITAKLKVDFRFDWAWQPDYMQQPKHYIFQAENPVNGLVYGHMAAVAYNRQLVLDTNKYGLDFTMSKPHEVVEDMLSGVAQFNTSPLAAWRTAFRECIKLIDAKDAVSKQRLEIWRTKAEGEFAEWVLAGADDATEYYELVAGDYDKLMLTFDWSWLWRYFSMKYSYGFGVI